MPGIVPNAFQILIPLVFIIGLRVRSYYPQFTDKESKVWRDKSLTTDQTVNNDRPELQTQSAWLHAVFPRVWTTFGVLGDFLSLLKLLLTRKASSGNFGSLVTSPAWGSKKSPLAQRTHFQVCVSTEAAAAKHDTTARGLGREPRQNPRAQAARGHRRGSADTAGQPQEASAVAGVAWKEVKTSGVVTFSLHLAEVVIHPGESGAAPSVRTVSLNNFSYPRFEQSTRVVRLSFRLAREQRSDWNNLP